MAAAFSGITVESDWPDTGQTLHLQNPAIGVA
jgi:hypothetical protein